MMTTTTTTTKRTRERMEWEKKLEIPPIHLHRVENWYENRCLRLIHTIERCCDRNRCFGNIWLFFPLPFGLYTVFSHVEGERIVHASWKHLHIQTNRHPIHTHSAQNRTHTYTPAIEYWNAFSYVYCINKHNHVYVRARSARFIYNLDRSLCYVAFVSFVFARFFSSSLLSRISEFLRCFTTALVFILTHLHVHTHTDTHTNIHVFVYVCIEMQLLAARKQRWWLNHRLNQHLDVSFKLIVS